ncbi:hypothetical protein F2Q69_00059975 [Brassica cretica]|uniref:Uncharacterized protein n=1 Tax=Brassica cretica TaxID=69181 RepID=A0A8S9RDN1_BRACR|nr:hypothetical protein F2Q69_00059975 [Brassica cretica]
MAGNREMGSLRSSGDSIEGDRAPARARSLALARARLLFSDRAPTRVRLLRSDRALARARSLCSDRVLTRARSLCSDRAEWTFGRYVATEPWLELCCYVATERSTCSVVV